VSGENIHPRGKGTRFQEPGSRFQLYTNVHLIPKQTVQQLLPQQSSLHPHPNIPLEENDNSLKAISLPDIQLFDNWEKEKANQGLISLKTKTTSSSLYKGLTHLS